MPTARPFPISIRTLLAALLLGCLPAPADAALVIQTTNPTAVAGGTGSFDVILVNTGGSFQVSAFSVQIAVAANSGITFTGASVATASPYIFGTLQSPPLTFGTFPNRGFIASDATFTPPYFVTLSTPGQVVGLEHVTFSVASGTAAGPVAVAIVQGLGTQVDDVAGNILASTTTNGTITVVGSAVPEPSSLASLALGLVPLAVALRSRRARRRGASPASSTP